MELTCLSDESKPLKPCLKVALTGGVGTGKSSVAQWFAAQGVPVVDTDVLVHSLLNQDEDIQRWLQQQFGDVAFNADRSVNRKAMGQQVFHNEVLRKALEAQLHPKVRQQVALFFKEHAEAPLVIAEVPLLFETGYRELYDEVWLVYAPQATQKQRLMQNRGLSPEEAEVRLNSQLPIESKRSLADRVFDNIGNFEAETVPQLNAALASCDGGSSKQV